MLNWGGKRALLRIALTGQRRGKGLKSDIPNEAKAAWEIVKSSVDALAAADLELHARDFAVDFESELDDGGGTLAHLQTLGRMRDALYGAGLNFEQLDIDLGVDEISFGNLVVYTSFGTLSLKYRLLKRNKQWQVRNLSIED